MFHHFMLMNEPEATEVLKAKARMTAEDRLQVVADALGEKTHFGEAFSIADIIMTTVLKTAQFLGILSKHDNLMEYVQRNESRPAFQRAIKDHNKLYEVSA